VHNAITLISYFRHRKNIHIELVTAYFKQLQAIKKGHKSK